MKWNFEIPKESLYSCLHFYIYFKNSYTNPDDGSNMQFTHNNMKYAVG
jgi:hypothetical protein